MILIEGHKVFEGPAAQGLLCGWFLPFPSWDGRRDISLPLDQFLQLPWVAPIPPPQVCLTPEKCSPPGKEKGRVKEEGRKEENLQRMLVRLAVN